MRGLRELNALFGWWEPASLCLSLALGEHVGQTAAAAVVAIIVDSHESAGTTVRVRALLAHAGNLAILVYLQ